MDELKMTVLSLIDLDEPEALLETLRRAAALKQGERWSRLAHAIALVQEHLDEPVDTTPPNDAEAKSE